MKKVLSMILVVMMVLTTLIMTAYAADDPTPYSGTPAEKWWKKSNKIIEVANADQLIRVLQELDTGERFSGKTIKLTDNIVFNDGDASKWETTAPTYNLGTLVTGVGTFEGIFDGNNKTISGIYNNKMAPEGYVPTEGWQGKVTEFGCVGLFPNLGANAKVTNLRITNSYFTGCYATGAVAGRVTGDNVVIESVQVDNSKVFATYIQTGDPAKGDELGGLYEKHCSSGGVIGMCSGSYDYLTFKNVLFQGTVAGGGRFVGGICGNMQQTHIIMDNVGFIGVYESFYSRYYDGQFLFKENSGGLIGRVTDKRATGAETGTVINNCFFIGHFKANDQSTTSGLLSGRCDLCTVTDFYANDDAYTDLLGKTDCKDTKDLKECKFEKLSVLQGSKSVQTIGLSSDVWFANEGFGPFLKAFQAEAAEVTSAKATEAQGPGETPTEAPKTETPASTGKASESQQQGDTPATQAPVTKSSSKRTRNPSAPTGDVTTYMIAAVVISAAAAVVISKSRKA